MKWPQFKSLGNMFKSEDKNGFSDDKFDSIIGLLKEKYAIGIAVAFATWRNNAVCQSMARVGGRSPGGVGGRSKSSYTMAVQGSPLLRLMESATDWHNYI